jgi:hypothetical protein
MMNPVLVLVQLSLLGSIAFKSNNLLQLFGVLRKLCRRNPPRLSSFELLLFVAEPTSRLYYVIWMAIAPP